MKENSIRFWMKVLTLQKEFTWFEYRYGEGAYCSICKTVVLQSEQVCWISKPHNLLKNDKAVSCKHHKNSARHKQNLNIIKMIKKWKRKGKGTVRTQTSEGNRNKYKTECLQNQRVIKKLAKSIHFMTRKHWATRNNYEVLKYHLETMKKNATYLSVATFDELQ